ncbi:MAG: ABC transporter ATP-binding protein [Caldilineae bacterium]|nr:MAG: ABC transporter ATP-binding protein [Caldilineae bacterium]
MQQQPPVSTDKGPLPSLEELLADVKPGETVLEMRGVTKRFADVVANDRIDFDLRAGEIHAVLGENGAGKTTLMNILFRLLHPDEGEIYIRGHRVHLRSPVDAINLGIGMVHQHRKLVAAHTVIENIVLGHPKAGRVLNLKRAEEEVKALSERYGFKVDLRARVWQLSEGEKQAVEILKALYRGARILILDEPTTALTPLETERLLESMVNMARQGLAVVPFITHKLPMVLAVSDRVTVLRGGQVVAQLNTRDADEQLLARLMVGREVLFDIQRPQVEPGPIVLQVEHLSALNDKGVPALENVSFSIRQGEILGIAGVSGNGQRELAEVLAGMRPARNGRIRFDGRDITHAPIRERWRLGIGYIPAERTEVGSIGDFTLVENVLLNFYFDDELVKRGVLDYRRARELTRHLIDEYGIAAPGEDARGRQLSGGNLQKVILARVLARHPRLLLAALPTQGLDIGATEFVRKKILEAKTQGSAVLLISEDLDEVLMLSDRIAAIYEGRIMGIVPAEKARREQIGAMIAGISEEASS